jgi:predicted phosphoribosyltransferase
MQFKDRRDGGRALGELVSRQQPRRPMVFALPRGGVPVGYEVAVALECELDVLVVRKVGVPRQPELAMGAIAEAGVVIRNDEIIGMAGVSDAQFYEVVEREQEELTRRLDEYRAVAPALDPAGRTAVVVDDGLATGSTAMAGVAALRERGAEEVWVAVPVAPRDTTGLLEEVCERVIVVHQPMYFGAVGAWYRDFRQTSDDVVRDLLESSRLR